VQKRKRKKNYKTLAGDLVVSVNTVHDSVAGFPELITLIRQRTDADAK